MIVGFDLECRSETQLGSLVLRKSSISLLEVVLDRGDVPFWECYLPILDSHSVEAEAVTLYSVYIL